MSIRRAIVVKAQVRTVRRLSRAPHRQAVDEGRREQLLAIAGAVAGLAKHRNIEPMRPGLVEHDLEVRRTLNAVIRRWSDLAPITYISASMTDAVWRPGIVREHVVPCSVMVDRMIMHPEDAPALLERALVLARISKLEHRLLGNIHDNRELYEQMLTSSIDELVSLGLERYRTAEIVLRRT